MKIHELIAEQPLDEGLGQNIGKAWSGAMKGIGAVGGGLAGSWDAMKQGYRAGKAVVSGRTNPDDNDPTLAKNQPASGQAPAATGTQPQGQQAPAGQGAAQTQQPPQGQQGATTSGTADQGQQAPATGGAAQQQGQPQGQAPTGQGGQPAAGAMKAADIVNDLDATWSKITADQGSETSSPQVQQKIRAMAKNAGMAGQVVERKQIAEFHSRFLNMTI